MTTKITCGTLCSIVMRILSPIFMILFRLKNLFTHRDILAQLHCKESTLTNHLIKKCSFLRRPFRPCLLAPFGYLQTLIGWFRSSWGTYFQREYIQMSDRGVVALDWLVNGAHRIRSSSAICLILPGLTGDALGVSGLCVLAAQKGFRTVVYNKRGFGCSVMTTSKLTGWGDTADLRQVVEYIVHKHPRSNIVMVGMGTDCGLLFSYLGEFGSSALVKSGVCISPVYDVNQSLFENPTWIYEQLTLLTLKRKLLQNSKALGSICDVESALKCLRLKDFVYHVFCKKQGNDSFESFCEKNDPLRDVDDIAVPLLCINSLDDPVSRSDYIPYDLFNYYPHLLLVVVARGGHCGFSEGLSSHSWAEGLAVEYMEAILEFTSDKLLYR